MKFLSTITMMAAGLMLATSSFAQAPAGAPAGSTGMCKDGSYYMGATKQGACRGHHGVKEWYGATPAAVAAAAPAPAPAAATAPAPAAQRYTPPATAAPGGGAGQVWVNVSTEVYHCPNDKWYGKTKQGEYMSEADAKAKGFHGDHGKACQ